MCYYVVIVVSIEVFYLKIEENINVVSLVICELNNDNEDGELD